MKSTFLFFILLVPFVYGQEQFFIQPNLQNQNLIPLAPGTQITPLCNPTFPQSCFNQWISSAQPLSYVSGLTGRSNMQFYLPGLINLRTMPSANENNFVKEGWKKIYGISGDTRYYQKLDSHRVREVRDEADSLSIREGELIYVSENDIAITESDDDQEVGTDQSVTDQNQGVPDILTTHGKKTTGELARKRKLSVRTLLITQALPGRLSKTKTLPEGCVVIDKQESGFCFECSDQKVNVTKTSEQDEELGRLLNAVGSGFGEKGQKCATDGVVGIMKGKGFKMDKICSPQLSLQGIISNFKDTCKPNNFKNFFPELYCQSCQAGVPPEVMLAKMTIESTGRCNAELSDGTESSLGLFQVNSKEHKCQKEDGSFHRKGTPGNKRCFFEFKNNIRYGIEIFKDYHQKVNPSQWVEHSKNAVCSTEWPHLDIQQRDSWRRAVSAYNGGPVWIDRAIQSVENVKSDVGKTRLYRKKRKVAGASRLSDAPWTNLRSYYFKERFFSASGKQLQGESGRSLQCTISNIAHTEAVLGSEVEGSPLGAVEYWDQYIKQNRPDCSKQ